MDDNEVNGGTLTPAMQLYLKLLIDEQTKTNKILENILLRKKDKLEQQVLNGYVIAGATDYDTQTIANDRFKKARVFANVAFSENATAGVTFELYYNGHLLGGQPAEILKISPNRMAMAAGSDSFDIGALNGFTIKIINHETDHSVTINSCLLYTSPSPRD